MKKEKTNWDDLGLNDSKIPLSARVTPQLKNKLMLRAETLGITLSEVVEGQMALDEDVYLKEKEQDDKKIAFLESQLALRDKTITELTAIVQSQPASFIKKEQELAKQHVELLNEQQVTIRLNKKLISDQKLLDENIVKFFMFQDSTLNDGRIPKAELEKAYKVPFDKKEVTAEGFLFEAVYMNPRLYIRKK